MNQQDHHRAIALAMEAEIEGLKPPDAAWLQQHLAGCVECSTFVESLGLAQQALRRVPVVASPELVAATQARVRIRALELRERNARIAMLAVSSALCLALSAVTLVYAWRSLQWLQERYSLAPGWIESGFVLSWFLPATVVALFLIALRPHMRWHGETPRTAEERS